jgi:hypothetical protein
MTESNEKFYVTTAKIAHKEKSHIPFERLEVGQSVFRSLDIVQEASMRSLVSVANRKYAPKFFKIAIHKVEGYIEIARVLNIHAVAHDPGITTSSEGMLKIIANGLPARTKYPFEVLAERQSFVVPIPTLASDAEALQKSLQTACYVQGKKYGKKFHLLKHDDYGMFEVGCISITEPVIYPISEALLAKANAVQTEVMPSAYEVPVAQEAVKPMFFTESEEVYEIKHDWEE